MQWLKQFVGKKPTTSMPKIEPQSAFYAVGDIHGRIDLLVQLLDSLDPRVPVVCVGDYVDRGDDSAAVLRFLQMRPDITCLTGNHEKMLLDFLDNPQSNGPRWLRFGGLQTLASFGISATQSATGEALTEIRNALVTAMGDELILWIRRLPPFHISGNVGVVHAGADPNVPITDQSAKSLIWGHPNFEITPRIDKMWIVHGHTIISEPTISAGRVAIDTGAYATGRLTAALISDSGISFTST